MHSPERNNTRLKNIIKMIDEHEIWMNAEGKESIYVPTTPTILNFCNIRLTAKNG